MSRFEGPQGIVTNGLVLNLDAGDPDSYTRSQPPYVEVLVVAGGGSGGPSVVSLGGGGGGGAGGVIYNSAYQLTNAAAAITVTVGAGGAGASAGTSQGNDGSNSVFGSLTAIGGGGGGSGAGTNTGRNGGSGGGAGYNGYYNNFNSGTGTTGQGFRGGYVLANNNGGGGGGAGGEGGDTFDSRPEPGYPAGSGGLGGPGIYYSISGTSTLYSTGGNGGSNGANTIVSGSGTKGAYGSEGGTSTAATGIVIVRYPGLPAATGGTITYLNGYTIHTFTSSGTFTPYKWNSTSNNSQFNVNNGTQFIPYLSGGTFDLDGTDDFLSTGSLNLQQNWTLEIWANMDSDASFGLFGQGITSTNQGLHILYTNGGRGMIYGMYSNDNDYENNYRAATGAWYQWVFTYNSSNYDKNFYANSLLQTPGSSVETIYSGTGQFNIGATYSAAFSPANGKIAITRFYNRVLTQAEITQNFNAQYNRFGIGLPTNGLVLNLDANNLSSYPGTGNTWYDLSGNNYNGTLTNGTSFLNTAYGGCFNFDGVDDYVDLQYAIIGGTGDFTVNQWIQADASEDGGTTFGNYPAGALQIFYGTTYMGMWLNNNSTYVTAPVPFSSNPVMITAIRSGTTTYFYQNGVLLKTGSSSANIGAANFRIGTNTSTFEQFTGRVFTTQAYNRALLSGEIGTIYATQKARFGL